MHSVSGRSDPTPEMSEEMQASAQALVDRFVTSAHQSIPAAQAGAMNEVDMGGSALCAAMQAVLLTTQADALPGITAVAFTIGLAFGGLISADNAEDLVEAMQALGAGIAQGMAPIPTTAAPAFGRA